MSIFCDYCYICDKIVTKFYSKNMSKKIQKKTYEITIHLLKDRAKKDGKYPVKLRIYLSKVRKRKYYSTNFELTEDEFNAIYSLPGSNGERKRLTPELKEVRKKLIDLEAAANEIADSFNYFTLEAFDREVKKGVVSEEKNLEYFYNTQIKKLKETRSYSTAELYQLSKDRLKDFNLGKLPRFEQITPDWLKKFEIWMTESPNNKSITTVSIYLRNLRTIFGLAISEGAIPPELYPFGKRKYMIPEKTGVKHALKSEELKKLYEGVPENEYQQKAKDFWFFSFFGNGVNIKDVVYLKWRNIDGDRISFFRQKSGTTTSKQHSVSLYINKFMQDVLKKYSVKSDNPNDFVFDIISDEMSSEEMDRRKRNFVRYINQHFKKYAQKLGVEKVNVKIARHSFATTAILKGQSMEFAQEALGHSNIKTTQHYFAGFEDETKKEFSERLMEF